MMKRALERIGSMGNLRLPAVLILLCAAFLPGFIGSASAYMTDRGNKMNGLGIGVNTIRIEEDFPPHAPVPGTDIFKKKVQICNTGTIPCYIRVYLAISDGETEKVTAFSADGKTFVPASSYKNAPPAGWTCYAGDGFFYCTQEIGPGKMTPVLLESVRTEFADAESVKPYDIYVYAESIQCRDKDGRPFEGDDGWKKAWAEFRG